MDKITDYDSNSNVCLECGCLVLPGQYWESFDFRDGVTVGIPICDPCTKRGYKNTHKEECYFCGESTTCYSNLPVSETQYTEVCTSCREEKFDPVSIRHVKKFKYSMHSVGEVEED